MCFPWSARDAPSLLGCNEGKAGAVVPPSSAAPGWCRTGLSVLGCTQLAVGGLSARLQPALMGQGGIQGVPLHLLVLPVLRYPCRAAGPLRKHSPGQHWHSTKVDGHRWSLVQIVISNSPQNKPTTYFHLRGDKNKKKTTKGETSKQCDLHNHEYSASMSPTHFPSACFPFQPITSGGQELSLTGCLCRSEHNGALILSGSFWCCCSTAEEEVLDRDGCKVQLVRDWKCPGGQGEVTHPETLATLRSQTISWLEVGRESAGSEATKQKCDLVRIKK